MAEEILFGIAEEILLKLGEQAVIQISQIREVKAELLKLRKTVSTIQAVLLDAEEKKADNQVKNWLEKLEDAVYDADDVVDEFRYAQLRRRLVFGNKRGKKVRIFFSKLNQFVFRRKMARKIRNIRETLDEINKDRTDFHLAERLVDKHHFTRLETDSFIIKDEVIGRDKDREKLLQFLLNNPESEENVSFMPVVGIGGSGKTTLAKLLYNHDEVQKHFKLKAWVCVSVDFDVKALVGKVIKSITSESLDQNLELEQLQNKLRREIDGKRYLLVLDDIWNEDEEKWLRLKRYLMCGARGSKVLITTRSKRVADITQTVEPHTLEGLDKDMSWLLFKTVAFEKGKQIEDSSNLAKIGREILDKWRGVPLAIKTTGRLLHSKQLRSRNPENEWILFSKLFKDSKLATIDGQSETDILPTLKLSYDNLPSRLKHCFAFCSLFPEDHEINVEDLIRLWIAQGFVKPSEKKSLEDVGYEYFVDLLWRSFFQEVEKDEKGGIISCKMHDLMHDLSIAVAGKGVIMLDQISKDNTQRMGNSGSDISTKNVRHAYVDFGYNASFQILSSLFEPKKLRTLLTSSNQGYGFNIDANLDAVLNFKFLRSLRLPSLEVLPYNLGELIHLRYLNLSSLPFIKVLPDSITRLHHLETLILATCLSLERLPQDTKKLVNLRHLELSGCMRLTHMPHGIGELTSLRTLTKFVVADDNNEQLSRQSARLGELSELKNLHGELEIQLRHIKDVALELKDAPLKDKEHLHTLYLYWNRASKEIENHEIVLDRLQPCQTLKELRLHCYMGLRLSNWLSSLTNLVTLELSACVNLQYAPPLHCLSSLENLHISKCNTMEYISEMDEDEFCASTMSFLPSLKELVILACVSLKGWWRSMKSGDSALTPMPLQETIISSASSSSTPEGDKMIGRADFSSLQSIHIEDCPNLASLPKIIFNVPSLQKVNDRQSNEFGSPDEIEAFLMNDQKQYG